jgi:hypothetical protein
MFHFPGFPPPALYIQAGVTPHHGCRVPPFGHPRINARLTAPRGLSRPPTSFIGSWYQGIHHAPSLTYTRPTRPLATPTRGPPTATPGCTQLSGCTRTHATPTGPRGVQASQHYNTKTKTHKKIKMLASAIQFSNTPRNPTPTTSTPTPKPPPSPPRPRTSTRPNQEGMKQAPAVCTRA